MSSWRIQAKGPLRGRVRVPSDVQIGQEALVWAALAEGDSFLRDITLGDDHRALIAALRAMGVPIAEVDGGVRVQGVGLAGLRMPKGALDAGTSPSTLELLAALLAGQHFGTRIEAKGRALQHSLRTLLEPLRARGAQIAGRSDEEGELHAPVGVAPQLADERLAPVEIEIPFGDPSTKRALLISGLYAEGITAISEGLISRDHTERALVALGLPIQTMGPLTLLDTSEATPRFDGFEWQLPGDFGLAAYLVVAALAVPGSDIVIEDVGLNRSRVALFDALRHAGAQIDVTPRGDVAGNEPIAAIRVRSSRLRGVRAGGELTQRLLEDVPAFAALVAASKTRVSLRDAGSSRVRADNLLKASAQLLRSFGVECTDYDDGFDADPVERLRGVTVAADAAPAIKLMAIVLGLCAEGDTRVHDAAQLDALYPGLRQAFQALGAGISDEAPASAAVESAAKKDTHE